MAKLSASEIAGYAQGAGLMDNNVAIATAVALAESGGNTHAHNPVPPDNSYGLWQINMLAHSTSELGISKNEDLYDPIKNAKAMYKISNGGKDWTPWTTYTSGRYKLFMKDGNAGAGTPGGSSTPSDSLLDRLNPFSDLADKLAEGHFWARIGEYILGFVLIIIGFVMLMDIRKAKSVIKTVQKAAG